MNFVTHGLIGILPISMDMVAMVHGVSLVSSEFKNCSNVIYVTL